jgi:hypothetical protein
MIKTDKRGFPVNIMEQALVVYKGWEEFQEQLIVPNLAIKQFAERINDAQKKVNLAEELRKERSQEIEVRNTVLKEVWELTKRIRYAARAAFGEDSKEAEEFGGVPVRFRKEYK